MANLSLLANLDDFPITRQTLFDVWSTASFDGISQDDLTEELATIVVGSSMSEVPTSPRPGQLYWSLTDGLMFSFFDEVDNTGVSLWLAIGPDRFDVPCLAGEPIPAGAPVDIDYDKQCLLPTTGHQIPLGFNQAGIPNPIEANEPKVRDGVTEFGGETTASGAWFPCAIDGIVYGISLNMSSHFSSGLVLWSSGLPLSMDPTNPTSLITANSWTTPLFNAVGNAVHESPFSPDSVAPSEPVYTFKFRFQPRNLVSF